MRKLLFVLTVVTVQIVGIAAALAAQKTAVYEWGWFGKQMSAQAERAIAAKGYAVTYRSWWWLPAQGTFDVGIGHSNGATNIAFTKTKKQITIDPPFTVLFTPCPPAGVTCINYYNPANMMPPYGFFFCCGGFARPGAKNIIVKAPHIRMPDAALPYILKEL